MYECLPKLEKEAWSKHAVNKQISQSNFDKIRKQCHKVFTEESVTNKIKQVHVVPKLNMSFNPNSKC